MRETFAQLALGQKPDVLFIACSDSRVVPNTFASTDPGDLFVIRNVGNFVPPCDATGHSVSDESEAAAIEFAVSNLGVKDIVVCGHSECGAMQALVSGREKVPYVNLKGWLRHGESVLKNLTGKEGLTPHNELSQRSVMQQLENLKTYPAVKKKLEEGVLRLHGWWFEISRADVYTYEDEFKKFTLIDEEEAERILKKMGD